jgi:23S rRNA pseudouridine1911/1915/1917 synthase
MTPYILDEAADFAAVFKPPRMHCAPLNKGEGGTLLDWYAALFPPVLDLAGKKKGEGGLVHRLDFETQGLVLFAKNQQTLDFLLARQEQGAFVKEYSALCVQAPQRLPGFPPPPPAPDFPAPDFPREPFVIKSFFRPFGPGGKQVRPLTGEGRKNRKPAKDGGGYYRTEISGAAMQDACFSFTLRIKRGFRHQIRCHLAWIGYPIVNDPLYGAGTLPPPGTGVFLALRACGLFFPDPRTGAAREYAV